MFQLLLHPKIVVAQLDGSSSVGLPKMNEHGSRGRCSSYKYACRSLIKAFKWLSSEYVSGLGEGIGWYYTQYLNILKYVQWCLDLVDLVH